MSPTTWNLPPYEEPDATTGNVPWPPDGFAWTGTGGITDLQSYAFIIHNAIYERLANSTFFAGFTVKRISEAMPVENYFQIPFLGIFEGDEPMQSDGPINMGPIGFAHTANFGVQVVMQDNDPEVLLQKLDQAYWFIMNRLWRDDTFTNRIWTLMPDNFRLEGVTRVRKKKKWGANASRNETPVGILYLDMQLAFNTVWAPTEFANLDMITVKTSFPPGSSPEEQQQIQQVTAVYTFAQPKQQPGGSNGKSGAAKESRAAAEEREVAPSAGTDEKSQ